MKFRLPFLTHGFCALVLVFTSCISTKSLHKTIPVQVYIPADKLLFKTVIEQDSLLFVAFNTRNITALKSYFTEGLEVYQDNTGLRNYEETVQAFTGVFKMSYILTRKPIIESIEVYPIKNFGAIETGQHTFCHTENGKLTCGTFKFVHIWENKNGQWKIAKIITYDHKE